MHYTDEEADEDQIWNSIIDFVEAREGVEEETEGMETVTTFRVDEDLTSALTVTP